MFYPNEYLLSCVEYSSLFHLGAFQNFCIFANISADFRLLFCAATGCRPSLWGLPLRKYIYFYWGMNQSSNSDVQGPEQQGEPEVMVSPPI